MRTILKVLNSGYIISPDVYKSRDPRSKMQISPTLSQQVNRLKFVCTKEKLKEKFFEFIVVISSLDFPVRGVSVHKSTCTF